MVPYFAQYMYASDEYVKKWGTFMGQMSGPKIGIVARGSNSFSNDKNRSCDLKALVDRLPQHASYVVLQKELSADECFFIEKNHNVIAPGMALETFSDTAAICTLLDQVISVDTGVAHLLRHWVNAPRFCWLRGLTGDGGIRQRNLFGTQARC